MKEKIKKIALKFHPHHVASIFETFLKDESIGGKLILSAALLSLLIVNSPLGSGFESLWKLPLTIGLGSWAISLDLRHWVNEGLMAFFFLVVGLEIKRELVKGELQNIKNAVLPIGAAVGGMLLPAIIYLGFNNSGLAIQGWGIPIATDIAFAVAVLSLLGNRVPLSLKIFLLTLAIADDIGAIFVIALFYAKIINYWFLGVSFVLAAIIFIWRKRITARLLVASTLGLLLWITTHLSGIHASIVGAFLGLLAPFNSKFSKAPLGEKVEKAVLPISTFVILPLFAFANAGFPVSGDALTANQSILWGVFFGLVAGKAIGIFAASWLLVRLNFASLPSDVNWKQILAVGFIAGIGFTVSIFITELAFYDNEGYINTAKIGIFLASATSALFGYTLPRLLPKK